MDQMIPQWLDAAVKAAGITTIYNAEDWDRITRISTLSTQDYSEAANDPSAASH